MSAVDVIKKKRIFSEAHRQNLSKALKGKIPWNKGKPVSEKERARLKDLAQNRFFSEETRWKISEKAKDRKHSGETRLKMSTAQIGRIFTDEHRKNMSKARKGIWIKEKHPRWKDKEEQFCLCGKKLNRNQKKCCSIKCQREWQKKAHRGENNPRWGYRGPKSPAWRGGVSFEPYSEEFNEGLKEKIRERDGFACQACGLMQGKKKLDVHHIDYNKKNNNESNLISLCSSCHGETNFNRDIWQELLSEKMHIRILNKEVA